MHRPGSRVGVLFSGGLDSIVLARLADLYIPADEYGERTHLYDLLGSHVGLNLLTLAPPGPSTYSTWRSPPTRERPSLLQRSRAEAKRAEDEDRINLMGRLRARPLLPQRVRLSTPLYSLDA
jgi:hypothetical protein